MRPRSPAIGLASFDCTNAQKEGPVLRWAKASKVREEEKNYSERVLNMRPLGSLRLIIIKKIVLPATKMRGPAHFDCMHQSLDRRHAPRRYRAVSAAWATTGRLDVSDPKRSEKGSESGHSIVKAQRSVRLLGWSVGALCWAASSGMSRRPKLKTSSCS